MATGRGVDTVAHALLSGRATPRLRDLAMLVAFGVVVGTLWLPQPPGTDRLVVLAILVGAGALGLAFRLPALARAWEWLGPFLTVAVVAAIVAATGGGDSRYADLYAVVLAVTALLRSPRRVLLTLGLVAGASALPLVYGPAVTVTFVTDLVADLAVWAAIALLVQLQSTAVRNREAELRERTREQERLVAQLRHLDRARTAFLRNVGHEVRTPLTVLRGGLELMEEHGPDHPIATRMVPGMTRSVGRLHNLLLDLTELGSDPVAGDVSDVSLSELVEEVAAVHDLGSRERVLTIPRVTIRVDEEPFRRAVAHLLDNIARHTPDTPDVHVEVTATAHADGWLDLTVSDDGPGFGTSTPHELLAPFAQGATAEQASSPGAGLGLAIVDRLARLHGGTVELGASPSGGARVTLRLPAVVVDRDTADDRGTADTGDAAFA